MPIILWESWSTAALAALVRLGVAVPAGRADGKVAGRSDIPEENNMLHCGTSLPTLAFP